MKVNLDSFRFTRAELDGSLDLWRWCMWLNMWGHIGAFVVGQWNLERTLWQ